MSNQIKIDVSQMGDVTIENKDGVVIITPIEKKGNYPEKGYYANTLAQIIGLDFNNEKEWKASEILNVYPNKNHAILFGQVLAPLLVKHFVLTDGYWDENCEYSVFYHTVVRQWQVFHSGSGSTLGVLQFPFPNEDLANQFLSENIDQLNKITQLWHNK